MKKDILIGGAWPYANYFLHVGHLAALLPGDILAKFFRENGDNVVYVSGSDCHGTPITQRALNENTTPEKIAKHYHEEFKKTFEKMNFEYDMYASTMDEEHQNFVKEMFKIIKENGYIYEKTEKQDYCENCKKFLSDREIIGKCSHCGGVATGDQCDVCGDSLDANEVLDKHCKNCKSELVLKDNTHLYFKLSAFKDVLQELIQKNQNTWRKNAQGEAQKYINLGLIDRAATRCLNWGVEVPVEGYEDKRIYVWIEAVLGYLSTAKRVCDKKNIDFNQFMSNDNKNLSTYYVHGKDNISFHTTIYPALVSALKLNYRLPDYIVSSAFVNLNNEKMSKSKGNLITVNELLEIFTRDTIRFYFAFKGPETNDMNCTLEDIIQTHNKFLVGMLGNFINRNLSFINKKFDGTITEAIVDDEVIKYTEEIYNETKNYFEKGEIKNATNKILEYINYANKYYDEKTPWVLVKENINEFNNVTYTCLFIIANLKNLIYPIIPDASNKIKDMLNLNNQSFNVENIKGDYKINNITILYDRLDEKEILENN